MKKSVFSLLAFIMLLCVGISCFANQPYKHPDYNLRTVKEIHITQIDNLEGEPARYFKSDENDPANGMLNRSLKDCFKKIFRK